MLLDPKITLSQMRQSGPARLHIICGAQNCSHSIVIDADCWPGSLRLSDVTDLFVCRVCGHRGADLQMHGERAKPSLASRAGDSIR